MESEVTIMCRQADVPLVENALQQAKREYEETAKIKLHATVTKEYFVSEKRYLSVLLLGYIR
jgi:hypothetical protein